MLEALAHFSVQTLFNDSHFDNVMSVLVLIIPPVPLTLYYARKMYVGCYSEA